MRRQETKKTENSNAYSKAKHRHLKLVFSLDYVHVQKSIIYIIMSLAKSTHQKSCLAAKLSCSRIQEKPVIFSHHQPRFYINNFAYLG